MQHKILLLDELGDRWGKTHIYHDLKSPCEAVKLLFINYPDLKSYFATAHEGGISFTVVQAGEFLSYEDLSLPLGQNDLVITPVVTGSRGALKAIIGVGFILATGGFGAGAGTALFGMTGKTAVAIAGVASKVGFALLLSGVSDMISPQPQIPSFEFDAPLSGFTGGAGGITRGSDGSQSYAYTGAANTVGLGKTIPVVYGKALIGGHILSTNIEVANESDPLMKYIRPPSLDSVRLNGEELKGKYTDAGGLKARILNGNKNAFKGTSFVTEISANDFVVDLQQGGEQKVVDDLGGTAGKGRLEFGNSGEQYIEGYDTGNAGSGSYLTIGSNTNERLRIDSDGRLIQRYSAAPYDNRAATFQSPAGQGQTYIAVVNTETNGSSGILFGDHAGQNSGNFDGYINYSHQYQHLSFMVGDGNERLRIEKIDSVRARFNFGAGNSDFTNPDIGGGTSGVSINKNTLGQIYACTDNADNTAANDYQTVCLNVARRNTSGDGPHIALDRGGWIKASIAGLQGSNTATSGPGIFAVYTHDYSSGQNVRTERLRISGSNGNVGISDDQPSSIPRKLWVYETSNDPYIRIQRGSTSSVIMGGYEIASSNGNGNNVLSTMYTRATGNSGTTGATIFQVRDQANNYEIVRLCSQAQGAVQGNRMLVNGNQVCVFGSPAGTSGTAARDGNTTTYNSVYEHSSSSYRTSDNGMFGGTFVVGGNANYWYPVWFQQPTNCPPQELWINKYVHNYATWDGSLFFRASLSGTGYGAYTVQHRVHFYSSSSKAFIGKIIYTGHNNAYLVCWMKGGGRSYGWGTTGGNGITVNVGDDGNSHNLGPGNTAETYITNNLSIPQGYEQAMTASGQYQQSDGF